MTELYRQCSSFIYSETPIQARIHDLEARKHFLETELSQITASLETANTQLQTLCNLRAQKEDEIRQQRNREERQTRRHARRYIENYLRSTYAKYCILFILL